MFSTSGRRFGWIPLTVILVVVLGGTVIGESEQTWTPAGKPPAAAGTEAQQESGEVDSAVINPYRSANVGALVGGEIKSFHFDEGDTIRDGQVVCEIDPQRYALSFQRAEERLKALEVTLARSEEEARIKRDLFETDLTTRQEVLRAESEADAARHRAAEARKELELARFDLDRCNIKAPFSGHLAIRYKQPDEAAERLERLFTIVDGSKVYAVGNVPETQLDLFSKGARAYFVSSTGKNFEGIVDKVGKLIDSRSRTKRVYLLIDNANSELEIGMTGKLKSIR